MKVSLCALATPLAMVSLSFAGDASNWPRWRGPEANGTSPDAVPPVDWSEEKNVKWKVPIPGKGSATPIVWDDKVFVLTAVPTAKEEPPAPRVEEPDRPRPEGRRGRRGGFRGGFGRSAAPTSAYQFTVICLDRATGETRWKQVAVEQVPHEAGHGTNTFASASPVTDGQRLYASFGSRGLFCYDLEGELIWQRDLGDMQTRNAFGEGGSPALHGDTLVVPWDHEGESFIVALDAKTGEERWRVDRDEPTTWATPLVVEHGGRTQVITNGTNRVRSYDLATGELIWQCGGQATNPIATPLAADGVVYCMTGYRGYAVYAIPLDAEGDITDTDKPVWQRTDAGPYVASPVLYGGQLYFTKSRDGILFSVDAATGRTLFGSERIPGVSSIYASLVAADGRIYITGRDGATTVIKHGPTFDVLTTNRLDEPIDASPALWGRQLFLRGAESLYCIEAQQ